MSSGDQLPVVAWRWIPSEVWGEYVVTCRPGDALMAKETGLVEVEDLVRKSDALAEREADRAAMRDDLDEVLNALIAVREAIPDLHSYGNLAGNTLGSRVDAAISLLKERIG